MAPLLSDKILLWFWCGDWAYDEYVLCCILWISEVKWLCKRPKALDCEYGTNIS